MNTKMKTGSFVIVRTGSHKNKKGKIIRVLNDRHQVLIEGITVSKRGSIGKHEIFYRPIDVSNVELIEETETEKS